MEENMGSEFKDNMHNFGVVSLQLTSSMHKSPWSSHRGQLLRLRRGWEVESIKQALITCFGSMTF